MIWKSFLLSHHVNLNIPEGKRAETTWSTRGCCYCPCCVCVCVLAHQHIVRERERERMRNTNEYLNELSCYVLDSQNLLN